MRRVTLRRAGRLPALPLWRGYCRGIVTRLRHLQTGDVGLLWLQDRSSANGRP